MAGLTGGFVNVPNINEVNYISADEKELVAYIVFGIDIQTKFGVRNISIGHNDMFYVIERIKTLYGIDIDADAFESCGGTMLFKKRADRLACLKRRYTLAGKHAYGATFKIHRLVPGSAIYSYP